MVASEAEHATPGDDSELLYPVALIGERLERAIGGYDSDAVLAALFVTQERPAWQVDATGQRRRVKVTVADRSQYWPGVREADGSIPRLITAHQVGDWGERLARAAAWPGAEASQLMRIMASELDGLEDEIAATPEEAQVTPEPGGWLQRCAAVECDRIYAAFRANSRACSDTCRKRLNRARVAATATSRMKGAGVPAGVVSASRAAR